MKQILVITALLSMLSLFGLSHAEEIYQWTDKDGTIRFSDTPPTDPNAKDSIKTMHETERTLALDSGVQNIETGDENGMQKNPIRQIREEDKEERHQIQEATEETEEKEEIEEESPDYLEMYRLEDPRSRDERKEDREKRRQIRDHKRIRER